MVTKRLAAAAALILTAAPVLATDLQPQLQPMSTQFYVNIPLDGATRLERLPAWGFAFRGARDYQVFNFNSRILTLRLDGDGSSIGGSTFDPTLLIFGGVAAGAAMLVGSTDKGVQQQQQQQVQQQQAAQQQAAQQAAENCPLVTKTCQ